MNGARAGLSLGVIVALAVAIWAAVSSGSDSPPTTTTTSTTSTTVTTATTAASTTTTATSTPETTTDPEARVEEVRLILERLWFGWFDAVYRNDEEAVLDVIATPERLENFQATVSTVAYHSPPRLDDVVVDDVQILRDDETCLAVYSTIDVSAFQGEGAVTKGVDILWPHEGGWRRATRWQSPADLWETDCTADRSNELP